MDFSAVPVGQKRLLLSRLKDSVLSMEVLKKELLPVTAALGRTVSKLTAVSVDKPLEGTTCHQAMELLNGKVVGMTPLEVSSSELSLYKAVSICLTGSESHYLDLAIGIFHFMVQELENLQPTGCLSKYMSEIKRGKMSSDIMISAVSDMLRRSIHLLKIEKLDDCEGYFVLYKPRIPESRLPIYVMAAGDYFYPCIFKRCVLQVPILSHCRPGANLSILRKTPILPASVLTLVDDEMLKRLTRTEPVTFFEKEKALMMEIVRMLRTLGTQKFDKDRHFEDIGSSSLLARFLRGAGVAVQTEKMDVIDLASKVTDARKYSLATALSMILTGTLEIKNAIYLSLILMSATTATLRARPLDTDRAFYPLEEWAVKDVSCMLELLRVDACIYTMSKFPKLTCSKFYYEGIDKKKGTSLRLLLAHTGVFVPIMLRSTKQFYYPWNFPDSQLYHYSSGYLAESAQDELKSPVLLHQWKATERRNTMDFLQSFGGQLEEHCEQPSEYWKKFALPIANYTTDKRGFVQAAPHLPEYKDLRTGLLKFDNSHPRVECPLPFQLDGERGLTTKAGSSLSALVTTNSHSSLQYEDLEHLFPRVEQYVPPMSREYDNLPEYVETIVSTVHTTKKGVEIRAVDNYFMLREEESAVAAANKGNMTDRLTEHGLLKFQVENSAQQELQTLHNIYSTEKFAGFVLTANVQLENNRFFEAVEPVVQANVCPALLSEQMKRRYPCDGPDWFKNVGREANAFGNENRYFLQSKEPTVQANHQQLDTWYVSPAQQQAGGNNAFTTAKLLYTGTMVPGCYAEYFLNRMIINLGVSDIYWTVIPEKHYHDVQLVLFERANKLPQRTRLTPFCIHLYPFNWLSLEELDSVGVKYSVHVQRPGQILITAGFAYVQGVSRGDVLVKEKLVALNEYRDVEEKSVLRFPKCDCHKKMYDDFAERVLEKFAEAQEARWFSELKLDKPEIPVYLEPSHRPHGVSIYNFPREMQCTAPVVSNSAVDVDTGPSICGKKFSIRSRFEHHARSLHDQRVCEHCYTLVGDILEQCVHYVRDHGGLIYSCPYCDGMFANHKERVDHDMEKCRTRAAAAAGTATSIM